jgi:hypothetical protein
MTRAWVGLGKKYQSLSATFDREPVLGVHVVDKTLEQTVDNLDPVALASPDIMDIVDGLNITL